MATRIKKVNKAPRNCPYCKSPKIETTDLGPEVDDVLEVVHCRACGKDHHNLYRIAETHQSIPDVWDALAENPELIGKMISERAN